MEYLGVLVNALFQPVNCVANYGSELLTVTGHFVQCVGGNILGATNTVVSASSGAVDTVASAVSTIGV